jgi:hypothetical protein
MGLNADERGIENQASAAAAKEFSACLRSAVCDDNPMEPRRGSIWQRVGKSLGAFAVKVKSVRKIPQPPLGTPKLGGTANDGAPKPPAPSRVVVGSRRKYAIFVRKN